jgi:hypothetical protein
MGLMESSLCAVQRDQADRGRTRRDRAAGSRDRPGAGRRDRASAAQTATALSRPRLALAIAGCLGWLEFVDPRSSVIAMAAMDWAGTDTM